MLSNNSNKNFEMRRNKFVCLVKKLQAENIDSVTKKRTVDKLIVLSFSSR